MKRILWAARNRPVSSQIAELKRLFGEDCQIDVHQTPYPTAAEITSAFKRGYYDEMVVIAPLSVCRLLTEFGYRPLYAEMTTSTKEDCEVVIENDRDKIDKKSRYYKFLRFRRLEKVELTFSEI